MGFYDLRNKGVFITGASSGIGAACARAFHAEGARVVLAARRAERLERLAAELGERAIACSMDVSDQAQRDAALARARQAFGSVDVLINNAGWGCLGSLLRTPWEQIERMTAVNLLGPIALTRAVLPAMIQRGSGQIINVTSVGAHQCIPRMTFYCATKAAMESLSTALRLELRRTGVDVIAIAPGATASEFFQAAEVVDVPPGSLIPPDHTSEDVARACVRASQRRQNRSIVLTLKGRALVTLRRVSRQLADWAIYRVSKSTLPIVARGREWRVKNSE